MNLTKIPPALVIPLLLWLALYAYSSSSCQATTRQVILQSLPFSASLTLTPPNCQQPGGASTQEEGTERDESANYGGVVDGNDSGM